MRVFAFFIFSFSLLLAAPETGVVTGVKGSIVEAKIAAAQKGMSAIILRDYGGGESITRQCVITRAEPESATLACETFALFEQPALPQIELPVKPGDRVILRPLGASATIVAPNPERYLHVRDRFAEHYRFVHPDLFAVQLRLDKNPVPDREDMQHFCDRHMVGTLIFALDDGDYLLDCQSFATLAFHADTPPQQKTMKPFFHRLDPIKRGFFSWATPRAIKDYDRHYRKFVTKDIDAQ